MKASQRVRQWFLAAVVVAVAGWFLAAPPTSTTLVGAPRRDDWRLERLSPRVEPASTAVLVGSATYWGLAAPAAASASAPAESRWRVAAVFGHGATRSVLISYPDAPAKEPLVLRVGDALPNGQRITKIEDRELRVKDGPAARTYLIQPLGPAP